MSRTITAGAGTAGRGLPDPVIQTQQCFRAVLQAMAYPGRIVHLDFSTPSPPLLSTAMWALCVTLLDRDTPVWLDEAASRRGLGEQLCFDRGAPIVEQPRAALFAVVGNSADLPALDTLALGTNERPEQSTTLLIEVGELRPEPGWRLSGPGIHGKVGLAVGGLPADFPHHWQHNHALFPRGVDVIFACGSALAALPRSVVLEP